MRNAYKILAKNHKEEIFRKT